MTIGLLAYWAIILTNSISNNLDVTVQWNQTIEIRTIHKKIPTNNSIIRLWWMLKCQVQLDTPWSKIKDVIIILKSHILCLFQKKNFQDKSQRFWIYQPELWSHKPASFAPHYCLDHIPHKVNAINQCWPACFRSVCWLYRSFTQ